MVLKNQGPILLKTDTRPRVGNRRQRDVFTIVNTLLLRPLPFERADAVAQVQRRTPFGSSGSFPKHDYLALTRQQSALSALAILDVKESSTLFASGRASFSS